MENIGDIIRRQRKSKGLTQEELGKQLFISKQSVSKWETGRTLPDIETLRKLCVILDIKSDEILGSSVEEVKHSKRWLRICIALTAISLFIAIFFGLGGFDYIEHHTQSGVAFLTVFKNGALLNTDNYSIQSAPDYSNEQNGYKFKIGYGEISGTVYLDERYEIRYGFINTNNWHNVQIRLDIEESGETLSVKQVVSYQTDGDYFDVIVTEDKVYSGGIASVFYGGV